MSQPKTHTDPVVHDAAEERALEDIEREPAPGTGLCLSGGGYRAMLFHVGSLWRLNEAGMLPDLDRISSVSGGSITAGVLGMNWTQLDFDEQGVAATFEPMVADPVLTMASRTIDRSAVVGGMLLPGSISEKIARKYRDVLFGDRTLQDLPNEEVGPRFVFNATNLQSGVLWRFSKPYMADYKVGRVDWPTVPLADVVAASSAFPPVLSPAKLSVDPADFTQESTRWELSSLQDAGTAFLSDGGVYDNLGLESVWKRYTDVLVSDGGGLLEPLRNIRPDWLTQSLRVTLVIDNQVRSLRKRQVIGAFIRGDRSGTYWATTSDIDDYHLTDPLPADPTLTDELAGTPTRLKRLSERTRKQLINWGYVMSDTALRKWVRPDLARPTTLPYNDYPLAPA